jgi:type II secretory pathway component PulM
MMLRWLNKNPLLDTGKKIARTFGRMSRRERRVLFSAAGAAAVILLYSFVIDPGVDYTRELREETPVKSALLARYQRTAQEKEQADRRLSLAKERVKQTEARLLGGASPALAVAELQELLKGLTAQHKVTLRTTSILPPEEAKPFKKVSLRIDFSTDSVKNLTGLLYDITHHDKALAVTELRVNAEGHQDPKGVQVSIVVAGLMRPQEER